MLSLDTSIKLASWLFNITSPKELRIDIWCNTLSKWIVLPVTGLGYNEIDLWFKSEVPVQTSTNTIIESETSGQIPLFKVYTKVFSPKGIFVTSVSLKLGEIMFPLSPDQV